MEDNQYEEVNDLRIIPYSVNRTLHHVTTFSVLNSSHSDTNTTSNATLSLDQPSDPLISFTVPAIMFTAGVLGNLLAIIFLARSSRQHRRSVFYRLVGALACTDLFGTCATSPVTLVIYANNLNWVGGVPLCNYVSFMLIFATCSTISIICSMAIDRYMSICRPFVYERYVSIGKVKYFIIGLWIFAAIMGCMPLIGFGEIVLQFPGTWCFFTFTSGELKNKLFAFLFVSIGFLAVAVTAISNSFVIHDLIKIWRKAKKESLCNACTHRHSTEIQMMVLMIGIVAIFTTCWCPFLIRIIINQINERQVDVKTDLLVLRLASLNQILDPWIYILFRKELFSKVKDVVMTFTFLCKPIDSTKDQTDNSNGILNTEKINAQESSFDNLKNNVEDSDITVNDLSTTSVTKSERRMSLRQAWQFTKLRHDEMSNLRQLTTQHKPACYGLKHPACVFSFSTLPQTLAMTIGMDQSTVPFQTIPEGEQLLSLPELSSTNQSSVED